MQTNMWLVPAIYTVAALVLARAVVRWDHRHPLDLEWGISASGATAALSALGSGMIAFTGFVTSIVLMITQFGSAQFSPRFLRWFRHEPTLRHALGTFTATFLFALVATSLAGGDRGDEVPYRTLGVALVLMVASTAWFIALLARTADNLRVAHVAQRINDQARDSFDHVYADSHGDADAVEQTIASLDSSEPVQVVRYRTVGSILQSVDRDALLRLAVAHDATIELVTSVGMHVPAGSTVFRVYGPRAIEEARLWSTVFFGDERTIEDDPSFAFRMLVDVAIKALSPAVNDPTTAVQVLHRIEDLLRYASGKGLTARVVTDDGGRVRLVYPTPGWDELVAAALVEIRAHGAGQYQVARRLRALLLDLRRDLPEHRHPALDRQLALLDVAVAEAFPDPVLRGDAMLPDRHGIGVG